MQGRVLSLCAPCIPLVAEKTLQISAAIVSARVCSRRNNYARSQRPGERRIFMRRYTYCCRSVVGVLVPVLYPTCSYHGTLRIARGRRAVALVAAMKGITSRTRRSWKRNVSSQKCLLASRSQVTWCMELPAFVGLMVLLRVSRSYNEGTSSVLQPWRITRTALFLNVSLFYACRRSRCSCEAHPRSLPREAGPLYHKVCALLLYVLLYMQHNFFIRVFTLYIQQ